MLEIFQPISVIIFSSYPCVLWTSRSNFLPLATPVMDTLPHRIHGTATRIWGSLLEFWSFAFKILRFMIALLTPPVFSNGIDWSTKDIPSLEGRIAIVTGSNSGIGFETASALASAKATVILAVRNSRKGIEARNKITQILNGHAHLEVMELDLSSLASIDEFATRFMEKYDALDILVNNAGIISCSEGSTTKDGFEPVFGTNHLGHFALTAKLLPALRKRPSRVVNVASLAAHQGTLDFDDIMFNKRLAMWKRYPQSKLANILFTRELQRRSVKEGWGILSVAAHPGMCSSTEMLNNGPGENSVLALANEYLGKILFPTAEKAIIPVLYAATADIVYGGGYYGPKHWIELRDGLAAAILPFEASRKDTAVRLWNVSVKLSKVKWGKS